MASSTDKINQLAEAHKQAEAERIEDEKRRDEEKLAEARTRWLEEVEETAKILESKLGLTRETGPDLSLEPSHDNSWPGSRFSLSVEGKACYGYTLDAAGREIPLFCEMKIKPIKTLSLSDGAAQRSARLTCQLELGEERVPIGRTFQKNELELDSACGALAEKLQSELTKTSLVSKTSLTGVKTAHIPADAGPEM